MALRLHCFGESGRSYKAALALELSGLDWTPVAVDFFAGETRTPDWRDTVNVMGECPVLEVPDTGERLSQSGAIQMWIADTTGRFCGTTETERRQIWRWVLWDNTKLSALAGPIRFLCNYVPDDKRPQPVIDWLEARVAGSYAVLDAHLTGRDWIVGDGPSHADFTCCGYLFYPEAFGFDRAAYPAIDAWLSRLAGLAGPL